MQRFFVTLFFFGFGVVFAQGNTPESATIWQQTYAALGGGLLAFVAAIGTALTGLVTTFGYKAWEGIKKYLASTRQGQLYGILCTALEISVSKMAQKRGIHYRQVLLDLVKIFQDGKVSEEEKAQLLAMRKGILSDAAYVAGNMIAECRGLAADQGVKYVSERLDALLGELEYRLTGSQAALIPSSLAVSVAENL